MLQRMSSASPLPPQHAAAPVPAPAAAQPAAGLGIDAGGSATRWALAGADGRLLAQGQVAGLGGLLLTTADGRTQLAATLAALAAACGPQARVGRVVAGLTGYATADHAVWQGLLAAPFGLANAAVQAMSDVELACRAAFPPGSGILVYAGTGSIAAHLDAVGTLHRAGGRGAVLDDAGGGYWVTMQALRHLWRLEDAAPGTAAQTPLGRQLFARIGGSDWAATRAWLYGSAGSAQDAASRGEVGLLALAVAAAAGEGDGAALSILQQAGRELARLAACLLGRVGAQPLALGGRVWGLHPRLLAAFEAALPPGVRAQPAPPQPEVAAARQAAAQSAA
jgi:N-acetylglucosamine kinase-like BadF-type ATPase